MRTTRGWRWLGTAVLLAIVVTVVPRMASEPPRPGGEPAAPVEGAAGFSGEPAILVPLAERTEEDSVHGARADEARPLRTSVDAVRKPARKEFRLRGRVLLPGGEAAGGAGVAMLELDGGAPVSNRPHVKTRSSGAGDFELVIPAWALDRTVLLIARQSGSAPYSERISLGPDTLAEHHELVLEEGFAIVGRVVRDGQPLPDVHVGIDTAFGVPGIHVGGRECWWGEGRLEEKHAETRTDASGRFRFRGLGESAHRLQFQEPHAPENRLPLQTFHVTAPDERVYDLTGAHLTVSVHDSIGRLEGATVRASMEYGRREWQSGPEPFVLEVPAERTIRIAVEHPAAEPVQEEVLAPGPGQWLDVVMTTRRIERPRLIVTLESPDVDPFRSLSLVVTRPSGGAPIPLVAVPLDPNPDASGGQFVVDAVPLDPGQYLVTLEPGPPGSALSFRYPDSRFVHLPRAGDVAVQFDHIKGGRFSIEIDSESEEPWSASYSLLDHARRVCQTGTAQSAWPEEVDGEWEAGEMDFEYSESTETTTDTAAPLQDQDAVNVPRLQLEHADRRALANGVLRPGIYTLEVTSAEHEPWTQPVEIKQGNVTILRISLEQPK